MKRTNEILLLLCCMSISTSWAATPPAVHVEIADGESAIYILYADGSIRTAGTAVHYGEAQNIEATDMMLAPSGTGYLILSAEGNVHTFGEAIHYGLPPRAGTAYVDIEFTSSRRGIYFLNENGRVIATGDAKFYGEFLGRDAVDLEVAWDGEGYYVLYQNGEIAFFGSAMNWGFQTSARMEAVDLELTQNGYYVVTRTGEVQTYGDAVALPFTLSTGTLVSDLELTSQGYRLLTTEGELKSILRLDRVGSMGWFATVADIAPAQATPTPTTIQPSFTPTPTPRANTPYFTFTQSGFSERIIGVLPEGQRMTEFADAGQVSLPNGGTFIVTGSTSFGTPKRIQYYSPTGFNQTQYTGEIFLEIHNARGGAIIRGISYSQPGLIVTVADTNATYLILVQGNFESTGVQGFAEY